MTGKTEDISHLNVFERFQWITFYEQTSSYPDDKAQIGRWLGPIDNAGTALTYKVLKNIGWFVCRATFRA